MGRPAISRPIRESFGWTTSPRRPGTPRSNGYGNGKILCMNSNTCSQTRWSSNFLLIKVNEQIEDADRVALDPPDITTTVSCGRVVKSSESRPHWNPLPMGEGRVREQRITEQLMILAQSRSGKRFGSRQKRLDGSGYLSSGIRMRGIDRHYSSQSCWKPLSRVRNRITPRFCLTGSGTAAVEASIMSCLPRGETVCSRQ